MTKLFIIVLTYIKTKVKQGETTRQQKVVITVTTALFMVAMTQTGLQLYYIDWVFVTMGSTRETIFKATSTYPSAIIELFRNITYFGPFILADWLMVSYLSL